MDPGIVAQAGHVSGQASPRPLYEEVPRYGRHHVDEQIRQVESPARQLRARQGPSNGRPGSQIEHLLRLADEQVAKIVQESRSAADELHAAAMADAAELRTAAENEADAIRTSARREADELRSALRQAGKLTS